MNRSNWMFAAMLAAAPALSHASALADLPRDGWVSWRVPSASQGDGPCCQGMKGAGSDQRGCRLVANGRHPQAKRTDGAADAPGELVIYLHRKAGRNGALHALGSDCPVELDGPLQRMDGVSTTASLDFLDASLDGGHGPRRESVLMAIAHHAGDAAAQRLIARSAPVQAKALRRDALFWLSQLHAEAGLDTLRRAAATDPSRDIRHHALFALSQADLDAARAALRRFAADHDSAPEDRGQALFWLVQSGDTQARALALEAAGSSESRLAEQAVFALSQLDSGAEDALIAVIEGDYPREARKRALFWLGQSESELALRYLDRLFAN